MSTAGGVGRFAKRARALLEGALEAGAVESPTGVTTSLETGEDGGRALEFAVRDEWIGVAATLRAEIDAGGRRWLSIVAAGGSEREAWERSADLFDALASAMGQPRLRMVLDDRGGWRVEHAGVPKAAARSGDGAVRAVPAGSRLPEWVGSRFECPA
jgi:hypothetical protein